ncbi:hypothetical protein C8R43DRAFT_871574 [Mycena crocata]|nr:hypothetical protein C8R43DRAFT_871574 [Mycena crocata]
MPASCRSPNIGCTVGLVDIETLMRDAQCRSALACLRNQLHIKSRLLIYKKNHSRHQGANTRSRTIVTRNESKIRLHSEKYQVAWEAIRRLSKTGDPDKVGWQILRKDDIRCMEDAEDLKKKAERRERTLAAKRKRDQLLVHHGLLEAERDDDMLVDGGEDEPFEKVPENRRQVSWIWTLQGAWGADADLNEGEFSFFGSVAW